MPCSGCSALHGVNPNKNKKKESIYIFDFVHEDNYQGKVACKTTSFG